MGKLKGGRRELCCAAMQRGRIAKAISAKHSNADRALWGFSLKIGGEVPRAVIDVRLITHILVALAVFKTTLVPFSIGPRRQKHKTRLGLAKMNAIVANQESERQSPLLRFPDSSQAP